MATKGLCPSCNKSLPDGGRFLRCSRCITGFHIGSCSGVTEGEYGKKSKAAKKAWECNRCSELKPEARVRSDDCKDMPQSDVSKELLRINGILTGIVEITEKLDMLMTVKTTVSNIEISIQQMSDKYDDVLKELSRQAKEINAIKKRLDLVEAMNSENEVKKLKAEANNLEQYSLRQNLEVHGLPQTENEHLLPKLNDLARKLELDELADNDLESVKRLPARPGKIPAVMVRFSSRVKRDQWMEKKLKLKEAGSEVRFFDNLTAQNKRLLWLVRTRAKENDYQFAWQKEGKMFVRKRQGDRVIKIDTEDDLDKIC